MAALSLSTRLARMSDKAKLTFPQVVLMRAEYAAGVRIRDLSRKYGITPMVVRMAVTGQSWRLGAYVPPAQTEVC